MMQPGQMQGATPAGGEKLEGWRTKKHSKRPTLNQTNPTLARPWVVLRFAQPADNEAMPR